MRRPLVLFLVLLATACSRGSAGNPEWAYVRFPDGEFRPQTPGTMRSLHEQLLSERLARRLPGTWQVAIQPDPAWHREDAGREGEGFAVWTYRDPTVTLVGDPGADGAIVDQEVAAFFQRKLAPDARVTTVRSANLPTPPVQAMKGPSRYRVEAGDTLATISAVFYGSAQHWRRIVEANPGLSPESLKPGQELVILPLPTPASGK